MASPFADAITASMVASMDPMGRITKDFAEQLLAEKRDELVNVRMVTMEKLEKRIQEAKDSGADGNVVAGYVRMLDRYSQLV